MRFSKENFSVIGCLGHIFSFSVIFSLVTLFMYENITSISVEVSIILGFILALLLEYILGLVIRTLKNSNSTKVCNKSKISDNSLEEKEFINPYIDTQQFEIGTSYPKVNYQNVFLKNGEKLVYAVPAALYKDKEKVVGYTGGSSGGSVRVAKGLYIRTGNSRSQAIRKNVREFTYGDYVITTKRVIFVPKSASDTTFELSLDKITAVRPISKDSIIITWGNKQKNILVPESQIKYALGLLHFAISNKDNL